MPDSHNIIDQSLINTTTTIDCSFHQQAVVGDE